MNTSSTASSSSAQNRNPPTMGKSRKKYNKKFKFNHPQIDTTNGPIYEFNSKSLILNESEQDWSETNPDGIVPVVVNPDLVTGKNKNSELKQIQIHGIKFLWDCFVKGKGGILAHGTGTGKTRTGITLIATLLEQSPQSRGKSSPVITKCLILAPKNAVFVWKEEIDNWFKTMIQIQIRVITPGQNKGLDVVNNFLSKDSGINILILSYESFLKYNSNFEDGFARRNLSHNFVDLVICDEAHVLKNPNTERVKNLSNFKTKAKVWFGFTATPFQNNLEELCNLVGFFRKDTFLNVDYKTTYCRPIMNQLKKSGELAEGSDERVLLRGVIDLIRPALQIRDTVLHIERNEITICIPLDGHPDYYPLNEAPEIQHEMYKRIWTIFNDKPKCAKPFVKLDILNKLCISPKLCVQTLRKQPQPNNFEDVISFYESHFGINEPKELEGVNSSKVNALITMVLALEERNRNKEPEKMVIVSLSLELLDLVKEIFDEEKIRYVEYSGNITSEVVLMKNLESFNKNNEIRFLLLSMKKGGTSLTLTRANHIVLMEPDYNPANDKQAFGRIYRHGQTRPVFVYRMLATGTIEEAKCILQLSKEELEKCFTKNGDLKLGGLDNETDLFICI